MTTKLESSYVLAVADQLSFVAAFLGGVSATILVSVLIFNSSKRSIEYLVGASSVAACGHLIAVISAWRLTIGLHPDLPFVPDPDKLEILWNGMIAGYSLGVLGLIASIGISGWIRSKRMGLITGTFALIAVIYFSTTSIYSPY